MSILFFAHDPGGANSIAPLIPLFEKPLVFAKGPALNILPNAEPLTDNALNVLKPNYVVTGTSANDFTERNLWKSAKSLSIPSIAILDAWTSYGIRFSQYEINDLHMFTGVCEYLPDHICVMDEFAKIEMIKDGVPHDRIITFGNPHFEYVSTAAKSYKEQKSNKRIVLFASEPFFDIYRKGAGEIALRDLIETIKPYEDLTIRIRKHPKESSEQFVGYLGERVEMDKNTNVFDSIQQAEIIVSVSSMVLIESMFFKKKIISYQPKSKDGKNDFILTRNGMLPFLQNINEFRTFFIELIEDRVKLPENNIASTGIIDNVTVFIKERLNG